MRLFVLGAVHTCVFSLVANDPPLLVFPGRMYITCMYTHLHNAVVSSFALLRVTLMHYSIQGENLGLEQIATWKQDSIVNSFYSEGQVFKVSWCFVCIHQKKRPRYVARDGLCELYVLNSCEFLDEVASLWRAGLQNLDGRLFPLP